jgi:phenylpyruvate tautomerase PptA (4-oxalocrotonate tautomerase family)
LTTQRSSVFLEPSAVNFRIFKSYVVTYIGSHYRTFDFRSSAMPLVRISLIKGQSPEHIRAISEGVHQSLVDTFQVPADDRFQLIQQYDHDAFIYHPDYLGIHRTDKVVFIDITASNWRDIATKQAFYKRLAELLAISPGLRPEDVLIVLSPNERADWSFGNGLASYVKEADTV